MDTFFARNRFSAYIDGSLPESEAAEVEAAIAEDPTLREEFDAMRNAVSLLRTRGPVDAPDGFHARVMAAVESEPAPGGVVSTLRRAFHRVPIEAMALAAAAVIVVMVIQGRSDPTVPPASDAAAPMQSPLPKAQVSPPAAPEPEQQAALAKGGGGDDAPAEPDSGPSGAVVASGTAPAADGDLRTGAASSATARRSAPTKQVANSKVVSAKGINQDAEPFYSDWERPDIDMADAEEEQAAGAPSELYEGIDMARPLAYRISLADSEILFQLSAAAETAGGRLTDAAGNTLRAHSLGPEDTWVKVHVVVPRSAAGGVQSRLSTMGAVATPPPSDNLMYGKDHAVFVVEVSHQP